MTPLALILALTAHHTPLHWEGNDWQHVAASGALAYMGSAVTESRSAGFTLAMSAGLLKETWDHNNGGEFRTHDLALNALGAGVGAWLYRPRKRFGFDGEYAYFVLRF